MENNNSDIYEIFVQLESHRRAAAAVAAGKFKEEIIPVPTKVRLSGAL